MSKKHNLRRQRPMKGGRQYAFAAIDPTIMNWARQEADKDGVHVSFVINNALSEVSGIRLFDPLHDGKRKQRRSK